MSAVRDKVSRGEVCHSILTFTMTALHVYNSGGEELLFTTRACSSATAFTSRHKADRGPVGKALQCTAV